MMNAPVLDPSVRLEIGTTAEEDGGGPVVGGGKWKHGA